MKTKGSQVYFQFKFQKLCSSDYVFFPKKSNYTYRAYMEADLCNIMGKNKQKLNAK